MQWLTDLQNWLEQAGISGLLSDIAPILTFYTWVIRWVMPVLVCAILFRCARSLLHWRVEYEIWAYVSLPNGMRIPVTHWENTIGRAGSSDIVLNFPTISRSHAVLIRSDDGSWRITDIGSRGGLFINDKDAGSAGSVNFGDVITLADVKIALLPPDAAEQDVKAEAAKPPKIVRQLPTLLLITLFQLLTAIQLSIPSDGQVNLGAPIAIAGLSALMWIYYFFIRAFGRTGFEVENIAFLLSTLGLAVTASASPDDLGKQFFAMVLGVILFVCLCAFLRDLERAKKARWLMGGAALALLAATLLFGTTVYGARNWIFIGSYSIQPSEFVKIAFIYAGSATLDRLLAKRNIALFIVFSGACIGALALLGDFGTALIFFVAFVVIAFMRSGDFATISLICAGAGFAGFLAMQIKPHIASRFSVWRHVWEYASSTGYQQTRTLMYAASGGILGLGAGNGLLKKVVASDTDLVFGILCEEWGLIVAVAAVLSLVCISLFAIRSAAGGRSSFYSIAACAAMSMLLFQTALNVFGSVDLLPLTGVTFPFVSNGGSSMLASWGLLAFVKAADNRKNASFAIKRLRTRRMEAQG